MITANAYESAWRAGLYKVLETLARENPLGNLRFAPLKARKYADKTKSRRWRDHTGIIHPPCPVSTPQENSPPLPPSGGKGGELNSF
jgi:hypothetical protein